MAARDKSPFRPLHEESNYQHLVIDLSRIRSKTTDKTDLDKIQ
jgi:hypothetical protein